jgi:uncharacterized protein (DUF1697 family)
MTVTGFVALLRAINVGGRSVKMAELVTLFHEIGLADAKSYIQSGNVIFSAAAKDEQALTAKIEAAILDRFGMNVDVILRSAAELKRTLVKNPFPEKAKSDPGHLVVVFLPGEPSAAETSALAVPWSGPEKLKLVGADLYITYPEGIGRSKLKLKLKPPGTARNWRVVTALADLVAAAG